MDSLTYAIILGSLFFSGIFFFTYFETPRNMFNKGVKKFKDSRIMNLGTTNKTLTIPSDTKTNSKNNNQRDLRVYVHEY